MKRTRIIALLLSAVMCTSVIMPSVRVAADEALPDDEDSNIEETQPDNDQDDEAESTDSNEDDEQLDNSQPEDSEDINEDADNDSDTEETVVSSEPNATEKEVEETGEATVNAKLDRHDSQREIAVQIDQVAFPDIAFRAWISENYDTNKDGFMSGDELDAVTEFKCDSNYKYYLDDESDVSDQIFGGMYSGSEGKYTVIGNIEGIRFFTKIKKLDISSTDVTNLDCDELGISDTVESIDCSWCYVSTWHDFTPPTIDVSSLTNLKHINVSHCYFKDLDFSNNKSLETIEFGNNPLRSVNLSGCTSLKSIKLDSDYGKLTDLKKIDITGCSSLISFELKGTKGMWWDEAHTHGSEIKEDDQTVYIPDNIPVKTIDFEGCRNLKEIVIDYTDVETIDCSDCPDVKTVSISSNPNLSSGFLDNMTKLEKMLIIDSCFVTLGNIQSNNLYEVALDDNSKLTKVDLSKCHNLKTLSVKCNENLSEIVIARDNLESVTCYGNNFSTIDLSGSRNLVNCCLVKAGYDYLGNLNVISSNLTDIDLSDCTALEDLDFSYNRVSGLDLTNCVSLKHLNCRNNKLSYLYLESLVNLSLLDCSDNNLSTLNISNNRLLSTLDCSHNSISSLDISNNELLLNKYYDGYSQYYSGCRYWYSDEDGSELCVDSNVKITPDKNPVIPVTISASSCKLAVGKSKTLTASGPADIVFKSNNKTVATVSSSGKVKAVKPGTATITAYSKSNPSNKATCKITVKYKLTYELNGGTNSADNPEWYTGTVKLKNPKSRKGYTFKGWYTDSKFKTKVTSVKNANKTLYAKWTVNSYKVKFDRNKGSGSMSTKTYKYGKEYQLPSNGFTRKGYTFTGWKDGSGKTYANKASVKNLTSTDGKTITLYAQWKAKTYTIDYKGLPEGAKNKNKTSYKITTATFKLDKASCPGYDFVGWYSDKKLTKKITSIAKGSTGNKTIYSKWTAHKYTIIFDANGGTGKMSSMKDRVYGKQYKLTINSFSYDDLVFVGWNTKADGSGTHYDDGATVSNLVTKDGGSITLFAQWELPYNLCWPVPGHTVVNNKFNDPTNNPDHAGLDIRDGNDIAGATVVAAYSGVIYKIYKCPNEREGGVHLNDSSCHGFGTGLVIRGDDERLYVYGHMQAGSIPDSFIEGTRVEKRQQIGKVGTTGNSTGYHLHFQVNNDPYDYWTHSLAVDPTSELPPYTYNPNA